MKISYKWLSSLMNLDLDEQATADLLTRSGLEVEGMEKFESVKGGLKGLVVGHILECAKHPEADRLSVTKVDTGNGKPLSIVCGAPNAAANKKVIVALPDATLYTSSGETITIKKSKIRGVMSEGMICAEDEIGLGKSHAGIMILPDDAVTGTPAADYFRLESDSILEIGLTPNRSDAASHMGVARDLCAILNSHGQKKYSLELPGLHVLPDPSETEKVEVKIENPEACRRYSGIVLSGIKVGESPQWLKNRLLSVGQRPVNNVVDVTNFVLHELGQPLHAFDLDKIVGRKVVVRKARPGERFVTLDGVDRALREEDLMICDEEKPMCIAGVLGGQESGVSEGTRSVFLESAYFDPQHIRSTAKHHRIQSEAAFRFERGTDPEIPPLSLVRAANLILELGGGFLSMSPIDHYPERLPPYKVAFSYKHCTDLIGKDIDRHLLRSIIVNLGIEIDSEGSDGLLLFVPRYKTDVNREADVVEEILRIYGYDNVEPGKNISFAASHGEPGGGALLEDQMASALQGFGFSEIMNVSLGKESDFGQTEGVVKLINPLSSDLSCLRTTLLPGGLQTISHNINRKINSLFLFEFGSVYGRKAGTIVENRKLAIFMYGNLYPENHYGLNPQAGIPALHGLVSALLEKFGIKEQQPLACSDTDIRNGVQYCDGGVICGEVNPALLLKYEIAHPVFYASFDLATLREMLVMNETEYKPVSRFPAVRRDLALLVEQKMPYRELKEIALKSEKKFLREVNLFDVFVHEKLGNKKSYALSFTFVNEEATLTDEQVERAMQRLKDAYRSAGAEIRDSAL